MKIRFVIRLSSVLLALLLTAGIFAGCAKDNSELTTKPSTSALAEVSDVASLTDETSEEEEKPSISAERLAGRFVIASGYVTETKYTSNLIAAEEFNGDVINDAIVRRTIRLEEDLGIEIEVLDVNYSTINKVTGSGERPYDIGTATLSEIMNVVNAGSTVDLRALDNAELDRPWWDQNANSKFKIGKRLYYTLSDFFITGIDNSRCVYFNKELAGSVGYPDVYSLVSDNAWTIDKMKEMSLLAVDNLNGDDTLDENDRLGIVNNATTLYEVMLTGCDAEIIKLNGDGLPYFVPYDETEWFITVYNRLIDVFSKDKHYLVTSTDVGRRMFSSGQALFTTDTMFLCSSMRMNSGIEFGIMPVPKYSVDQEKYLHVSPNPDVFFIIHSGDSDDLERIAGILNYASFYSSEYYADDALMPCYFEVALTTKSAPDYASSNNLHLVHDNISYVIKIVGTDLSNAIYTKFKNGSTDLSDIYKSTKTQNQKNLEKVLRSLGAIN
ncbi:MAG: hypothetical protein ILO42_01440 [Clostridia bacterium]|nr:hypothetical protein [Clostridia bacterium]